MPGLNLQAIEAPKLNVDASQANPNGVLGVLSQSAPQSLTALLMPLFNQLFGAQQGSLQQRFGAQGEQGMAQAQSDAMKRGITGSSIEESGIQSALANSNMGYNDAYSQLLGNLVNSYSSAAGQDISNKQNYFQSIAQGLGQTYAAQQQQQQFQQQLQEAMSQAGQNRLAGQQQAIINGAFNIGSKVIGNMF